MRKFKLIKEYPQSEPFGLIVTLDERNQYVSENTIIYQKNDIEMYPEFWQPIYEFKEVSLIEHASKVKQVLGWHISFNKGDMEVKPLSAPKESIYMTTDGTEIFEGDQRFLFLLEQDNILGNLKNCYFIRNFSQQDREVANRYLTFTSEENRDKYIKENTKKPIFVSADDKELKEGDVVWYNNSWNANWRYLKIESLHPEAKYFSTKESCLEYITENKPKFSLKEIESCYPSPTNSPLFTTFIANLQKLGK